MAKLIPDRPTGLSAGFRARECCYDADFCRVIFVTILDIIQTMLNVRSGNQRDGDLAFIELDLDKMEFRPPALGPNEQFSLVITPPTGYRYAITRETPSEFSAGDTLEIPGWN